MWIQKVFVPIVHCVLHSSKEEGISSSSIGGTSFLLWYIDSTLSSVYGKKSFGLCAGYWASGRAGNVEWHCSSSWCLDFSFATLNSIAVAASFSSWLLVVHFCLSCTRAKLNSHYVFCWREVLATRMTIVASGVALFLPVVVVVVRRACVACSFVVSTRSFVSDLSLHEASLQQAAY